jgi:hypothetical protein
VLAPLGLRGDPHRYLDVRFAGWVTKPLRHSRIAEALQAAYAHAPCAPGLGAIDNACHLTEALGIESMGRVAPREVSSSSR